MSRQSQANTFFLTEKLNTFEWYKNVSNDTELDLMFYKHERIKCMAEFYQRIF